VTDTITSATRTLLPSALSGTSSTQPEHDWRVFLVERIADLAPASLRRLLGGLQLRNIVEVDQSSVLPTQTPRYETVPVVPQSDTGLPRTIDDNSLLNRLRLAAEAEERLAFAALVESANWLAHPSEILIQAVTLALNREWITLAVTLAQRGAALFPDDEAVQRTARTLSPPAAHTDPGEPPHGLEASRSWLQTHAMAYRGQWVAVYDGHLLGSASSLDELRSRIGSLTQPASTIITRVL
jgi:hypothetical protein